MRKNRENLTRPYDLKIRASAEEKKIIDEKAKEAGLSRCEFALRAILGKEISSVRIDGVDELMLELKREGNNLNQAVKNFYVGEAFAEEILYAERRCVALYEKINEKLRSG